MRCRMEPRIGWVTSTPDLKNLDVELRSLARPGIPLLLVDANPEPIVCFWMMRVSRKYSSDTVRTYSHAIEAWWRMLLIRKIRWWEVVASDFEIWVEKFRIDGLSPSSLHTMGAGICNFYEWAHRNAYINRVPFRISDGHWRNNDEDTNSGPPKVSLGTVRRKQPAIITTEQFDKILANVKHHDPGLLRRDELMAMCGKWMGLRRAEVVGLKVSQLQCATDLKVGRNDPIPFLAIELDPNSTKGGKGGIVLAIPMLVKKFRDYIAPGSYREQIIAKARRKAKAAGKRYVEPDEVFLTAYGTPFRRETLSSYFRRAARAAGLDSRFHGLRHTSATNVAEVTYEHGSKGYQIVRSWLRHANEKTSAIYVDQRATQSQMYQSLMSLNDLAKKEEQQTRGEKNERYAR